MEMKESRREFLMKAGTLGAGICCLGSSAILSSCGTARRAGTSAVAFTETQEGISIPVTEFAEKNAVIILTRKYEEPVYVARETDGTYRALRMVCPHKGCEVRAGKEKFICPCHGSEFSMNGAVLKGPSKDPLPPLEIRQEANLIMVRFQ
jgi:cytochrome b6-f complex iron-sulfur subunit